MAETLHNFVKSSDKTLIYVEGATHGYSTARSARRRRPVRRHTEDALRLCDGWLSKSGRFM